jgi:hypothetical protein
MTILEHKPGIIDFIVRQGADETYVAELFSDDAQTIAQDLSNVTAIRMQVRRGAQQFAPALALELNLAAGIRIATRAAPGVFDLDTATPAVHPRDDGGDGGAARPGCRHNNRARMAA